MRPSVSVIVPFKGSRADAERVLKQLHSLEIEPGDELIVADNSPTATIRSVGRVRAVRAPRFASSYYARNAGAEAARGEWLLFTDSDCLLHTSLIRDYFEVAPSADCGIRAGELDAANQRALIADYERSRGRLEVAPHLELLPGPAGITANLLVRRQAWEAINGFAEVRSGADLDFCWRAQSAGWGFEYWPQARVSHLHCETLRTMLRKARRYGPGQAWLNAIYPGSSPPRKLPLELLRALAGAAIWPLCLQPRRGLYKALDGLWAAAYVFGYRFDVNQPRTLTLPASPEGSTAG